MNFLDQIWLIPLFPLFGAALMLLFGKMLDPQPASEVAVAPGVEPVYDEHHGHGGTSTRTGMGTAATHDHGHHAHSPLKIADQFHLPGHGAALVHLLGGRGVAAFAADRSASTR